MGLGLCNCGDCHHNDPVPDWICVTRQRLAFTGFILGVEDGNSYIAKMLSGSAGSGCSARHITAYPQSGVLAFLPYILLGKLASPAGRHEQLVALFHLFRWIAIIIYAFAAYDFISIFIREIRLRRTAISLIFFGGGLGFLAAFGMKWSGFGGLPLEFYSPESFGFLAVFGLPHIAAGRAFLLWGLGRILKYKTSHSLWREVMFIAACWTLLGDAAVNRCGSLGHNCGWDGCGMDGLCGSTAKQSE